MVGWGHDGRGRKHLRVRATTLEASRVKTRLVFLSPHLPECPIYWLKAARTFPNWLVRLEQRSTRHATLVRLDWHAVPEVSRTSAEPLHVPTILSSRSSRVPGTARRPVPTQNARHAEITRRWDTDGRGTSAMGGYFMYRKEMPFRQERIGRYWARKEWARQECASTLGRPYLKQT